MTLLQFALTVRLHWGLSSVKKFRDYWVGVTSTSVRNARKYWVYRTAKGFGWVEILIAVKLQYGSIRYILPLYPKSLTPAKAGVGISLTHGG